MVDDIFCLGVWNFHPSVVWLRRCGLEWVDGWLFTWSFVVAPSSVTVTALSFESLSFAYTNMELLLNTTINSQRNNGTFTLCGWGIDWTTNHPPTDDLKTMEKWIVMRRWYNMARHSVCGLFLLDNCQHNTNSQVAAFFVPSQHFFRLPNRWQTII